MGEEIVAKAPGDYIRDELVARGWGQQDLASILGRPLPTVNEIIQGKRAIMPEMAVALGTAFGNGAKIWMEREGSYRLSLIERSAPDVHKRARLYDLAPVKEMEKRGWISPTDDLKQLEGQLLKFFNTESLDEEPAVSAVARQSMISDEFTSVQRAWLFRAAQLARLLNVKPFAVEAFKKGLPELRSLANSLEGLGQVPAVLADLGVRLVIIEALPRSRIDGAMFWLDATSPVIVLSVRYDRIDWFWHTLAHEIAHIANNDLEGSIDSNLVGESRTIDLNQMEQRADRDGAEFLVPQESLRSFVLRIRPYYYKTKIVQFAKRINVHPGIVNGQLQHLKEIGWNTNREMLVKVKDIITTTAITDGWGQCPRIV